MAVALLLMAPLWLPGAFSIDGVRAAAPSFAPHAPGVVLVAYEHGATATLRASVRAAGAGRRQERLSRLQPDLERLVLGPDVTVAEAIRRISRQPGVRYVEPDYLIEPTYIPDDPSYVSGSQWGVGGSTTSPASQYGAGASKAWAAGYVGSREVYVGIVDEGIQYDHPDLAANVWTNPFDPRDGRDNDGNGYVDDIHGWDFFNNDNTVFDGTSSDGTDDHGTHVAGIVGAEGGNSIGVAGVNWAVTMIPAKFLGPSGGSASGAIRALDYVTDLKMRHGLNVVATNNSWGTRGGYGQALRDAIDRSGDAGMLFVAAAGNNGTNNDTYSFNPASFQCTTRQATGLPRGHDCILSVASIASSGALSSFSNFGARTVDLGAPGQGIKSTFARDHYGLLSGTSMATPHVTGALALCASMNPALDAAHLRAAVLDSTAPTASLTGKTVTGGRLDMGSMLSLCAPPYEPVFGSPTQLRASIPRTRTIALDWADEATNEQTYEIQRAGATDGGCAPWEVVDIVGANSNHYEVVGEGGMGYCFRVRGTRGLPGSSVSPWSNEVIVHLPALPPGAPSNVLATAQNMAASVTWARPAFDGGSAITGYLVRGSPGGQTCATSGELTCTVGGLTNGTAFTFTVEAHNADSTGPASGPSNAVIPATTPTAPTAVDAAPNDSSARVTWQPPVSNGGRAVSGYTVLSSPGGMTCSTTGGLACLVPGLSNGTAYTFTVRASNAVGAGPWSGPSPAVVPAPQRSGALSVDVPAVALVAVRPLGDTVAVRLGWGDGTPSSSIASYQLQRRKGSGVWRNVTLASPRDQSVIVALSRTATHRFRLRAWNASGLAGDWAITPRYGFGLLQETSDAIAYGGAFVRTALTGSSGGYVRQTSTAGRIATLTFDGSGVALVTTLGPARGIAEIWVDGSKVALINLYASSIQKKQLAWAGEVVRGPHLLQVRVTGNKDASSTSTRVDIDAFLILR